MKNTRFILFAPLILAIISTISCGGRNSSSGGDNQAPQANAGSDLIAIAGDSVTLDGSASSDPDGSISQYSWSETSSGGLSINNANAAVANFTAPAVSTETVYQFQLSVTDDGGASATDSMSVTVMPRSSSQFGLDSRPNNQGCLAGAAPPNAASVQLTRPFNNLPAFNMPTSLKQLPSDSTRWYVLEKAGRVLMFSNSSNVSSTTTVLDIRNIVDDTTEEAGLLAMAFHPDFVNNGYMYLFYQVYKSGSGFSTKRDSVLARFKSNNGGQSFDPNSRVELIRYEHPYANHFGGELEFDDEGYLYFTVGDGGYFGDPQNRAQTTTNIFGSIMRLDVNQSINSPPYYGIPSDNPFYGNPLCSDSDSNQDCPEIYAWGLRNGWRFSFDEPTGTLWLGDVGQDAYEEIDIIYKGGNYGWRFREGFHCYNPSTDCPSSGLIDPVAEVPQPQAQSITGGFVYRGDLVPALKGKYVFADYVTGNVWALFEDENGVFETVLILSSGYNIAHFAVDRNKELYALNFANGYIYRFSPAQSSGTPTPEKLSQTGCVLAGDPKKMAPGVISYSINAPFWSDGADKSRYFAIPNNTQISVRDDGQWEFPVGSVLIKNFKMNNQLIETRFMKHHSNGSWAGYSYAWNQQQTDADLVYGGQIGAFNDANWIYPAGSACLQCHTEAAGRALGLSTAQLNKTHTFEATGRNAPQIDTLANINLLSESTGDESLIGPMDTGFSLGERARAYLHTNCAQCHRPNGPTNVDIDLRYTTSLSNTKLCNVQPQNGDLGIVNARRLTLGNANNSLIYARMNSRDELESMPPVGSYQVDSEGVELIRNWINSLNSCQ